MPEALRVLLVEDNEGDVEMTQRALRDSKPACKISVANDGIEALSFLKKEGSFAAAETPQLILLDLNMPRMDGKKLLETIKGEARFKAIPVVMLTSSESPQDVLGCYERYASGYVVKPFDAKDFAARVKQVVSFWGEIGRLPN